TPVRSMWWTTAPDRSRSRACSCTSDRSPLADVGAELAPPLACICKRQPRRHEDHETFVKEKLRVLRVFVVAFRRGDLLAWRIVRLLRVHRFAIVDPDPPAPDAVDEPQAHDRERNPRDQDPDAECQ